MRYTITILLFILLTCLSAGALCMAACDTCTGSGVCQVCSGSGKTSSGEPCYICSGSKKCYVCEGSGDF